MAYLQSQFDQAKEAIKNGYKLLAESLLDDVVGDDPGNQEAWQLLAKVSNPKKANECVRRAAEIGARQAAPNSPAPGAVKVSGAGAPKPPGILAEVKSLENPLGAVVSLFEQAQAAIRHGDKNWAMVLLKDFLKQEPKNDKAWVLLAQVVNNPQEAVDCLRHALEIRPGNQEASQRLAEILAKNTGADPIPPLREAARQVSRRLRPNQGVNFLKRWWIALLIVALVLLVANLGWLALLLVMIVAVYVILTSIGA